MGRLERGKWTFFRKDKDLPSEIVTELLETTGRDGTRTIWAATSRGIARYQAGRWSVVGKDGGLLSQNVIVSRGHDGRRGDALALGGHAAPAAPRASASKTPPGDGKPSPRRRPRPCRATRS